MHSTTRPERGRQVFDVGREEIVDHLRPDGCADVREQPHLHKAEWWGFVTVVPPNNPVLLVYKEVTSIGFPRPNVPFAGHDSPSRSRQKHGRRETATDDGPAATAQKAIPRACPELADTLRIEQEVN